MKKANTRAIINFRFIAITVFFIALITALAGCGAASGEGSVNSSAQAQEIFPTSNQDYVGSIEVTGEASAEFIPDIAMLNLAIETTRDTVREASNDVNEVFTRVVAALENSGIDKEDIKADNIRIQPESRWMNDELVTIGYKVWRNITVTVRDLEIVSNTASAIITSGGNAIRFYGVEFHLEDPDPKRAELKAQAARNARASAEIYAKALDVELGPVIYISEQSNPYTPYFARAEGFLAESASADTAITNILPGDVTVSVQILARFSIER